MATASRLDTFYRSFLVTRFFTKGWGRPEHIKKIFALRRQMADRQRACAFVDANAADAVSLGPVRDCGDHRLVDGSFETPAASLIPEIMPKECRQAHFQLVLPPAGARPTLSYRPLCIQYAGTGDHFFWRRRRLMALPLLKDRGIASIILENPFYGMRKPHNQLRSSILHVSDIFVMGCALILETLVLFHWCRRQGYWPVILHGISMGGHMASLGATVWPEPVGIVPCLSLASASLTFTKGVLANSICWDLLERQYNGLSAYKEEIEVLLRKTEGELNAFKVDVGSGAYPLSPDLEESVSAVGLPYLSSWRSANKTQRAEVLQFMRCIMDECTHLDRFAVPVDPTLCIAMAAALDAYQPKEGLTDFPKVWPGAQLRFIDDEGHVASYLFKQDLFRTAIYEVLDTMLQRGQECSVRN